MEDPTMDGVLTRQDLSRKRPTTRITTLADLDDFADQFPRGPGDNGTDQTSQPEEDISALNLVPDNDHLGHMNGTGGDDQTSAQAPAPVIPPREAAMQDLLNTARSKRRSLTEATEDARARKFAAVNTLPAYLAFLDEEIFPKLEALKGKQDPDEIDQEEIAGLQAMLETVTAANPEVKKTLEEREHAKAQAKRDLEERERNDERARFQTALNRHFEEMRTRATAPTLHAALEEVNPTIPPPVIIPGQGVVLIQISRPQSGDQNLRRVEVDEETEGLNFKNTRVSQNAKPGMFAFTLPGFRRGRENDRLSDPFDSIKRGLAEAFEAEEQRMKEDEQRERRRQIRSEAEETLAQFQQDEHRLTAFQMIVEGASGKAFIEATFHDGKYEKHLQMALVRAENGVYLMRAYGSSTEKWPPQLSALRRMRLTITQENLQLSFEDDGTPKVSQTGIPQGKGSVKCRVISGDYQDASEERRKNMDAQFVTLGRFLQQAVLNDLYEQHLKEVAKTVASPSPDEGKDKEEAMPQASAMADASTPVPMDSGTNPIDPAPTN